MLKKKNIRRSKI